MLKIIFGVIFNNVITEESEVEVHRLRQFLLLLYRVNTINPRVFVWLGNAFQKHGKEIGIRAIKYFPIDRF